MVKDYRQDGWGLALGMNAMGQGQRKIRMSKQRDPGGLDLRDPGSYKGPVQGDETGYHQETCPGGDQDLFDVYFIGQRS